MSGPPHPPVDAFGLTTGYRFCPPPWIRPAVRFPTPKVGAKGFPRWTSGRTRHPSTSGHLVRQRSYRGRGPAVRAWVLQQTLRRAQSVRRVASSDKLETSQPIHQSSGVQNGNSSVNHSSPGGKPVGSDDRPIGCLLPRADASQSKTFPPVCVEQSCLPIQGITVRPEHGALCLHVDSQTVCAQTEGTRDPDPRVPGRLANSPPIPGHVEKSSHDCTDPSSAPGVSSQHAEIATGSGTSVHLSGGGIRSSSSDGTPPNGQVPGHSVIGIEVSETISPTGVRMDVVPRQTGIHCSASSGGQITLSTISVPAKTGMDIRVGGGPRYAYTSLTSSDSLSRVVAGHSFTPTGGTVTATPTDHATVYGRKLGGVGSPPPTTCGLREMVGSGETRAHQCIGNACDLASIDAIQGHSERPNCDDCNGQLHSVGVPPESGRNQELWPPGSYLSVLCSGCRVRNEIPLPSCPRTEECSSRPTFEGRSSHPDGVDHECGSVTVPVESMAAPAGGCVRDMLQPQTSEVLLTGSAPPSTSSGCAGATMGRAVAVHVSSDTSSASRPEEVDPPPARRGDSDLPKADAGSVVSSSRSSKSKSRSRGHSSSSKGRSRSSTHHRKAHVERPPAGLSRIEVIKFCLRQEGHSEPVIDKIMRRTSEGTSDVYDSKWSAFDDWCQKQEPPLLPTKVNALQLENFLNYLIDVKKLARSTIAGYISGLQSVFMYSGQLEILRKPAIKDLSQFVKTHNPNATFIPPKWNLPYVLHRLTEPPFEPLEEASMKHLTWKTAFLVLWGTACRRSELHALDFETFVRAPDWSYVELYTTPDYRAKFQRSDEPRMYVVRRLDAPSGEDAKCCPVRALRIYLDRTNNVRDRRRRLFLSINPKVRDIVANTVSSWIKSTILQAYSPSGDLAHDEQLRRIYEITPDERAKLNLHRPAHEVRAQSASYRFASTNCALTAILKACYWKRSHVFITYYLRDVTVKDKERLYRLSHQVFPGEPGPC